MEKEDAQSRVYVGNDNKLFWTAEDQISIFAGNTVNTVYQFDGETGATSGTFTAVATTSTTTGSDLSNNYAVYPYNEATTISTEGVITTTLPATQKYAENSFGMGDNTMCFPNGVPIFLLIILDIYELKSKFATKLSFIDKRK